MDDDDAEAQQQDGAHLEEGGQVVARCQQQPDRQHGGDEPVADDDQCQCLAAVVEPGREGRRLGHGAAIDQRGQQEGGTDQRHLADAGWPDEAAVDAHDQCDRDGADHGEAAPWAPLQRVHHHEGKDREDDDADQKDADAGDAAGERTHLRADHVAERLAVSPGGQEEDGHVLHGAGEHDAGEDPQRAWQIAHLGGEYRADQRAGAGDGGEVVAEQHEMVGRHVVEAIIVAIGRRHPVRIDAEDPFRDVKSVKPVGDEVYTYGCDHQPCGVYRLTASECHDRECNRAQHRDRGPHDFRLQRHISPPRYGLDRRLCGERNRTRGPVLTRWLRGQSHPRIPGALI